MRSITISFFVVICLISTAYGRYPYQTDEYYQHAAVDSRLLIAIYAAIIIIPIVSVALCCLCCAASPVTQCCCPNRKNIYHEGVIIDRPSNATGTSIV